jgi:Peptidase inhibitor family I36
MTRLRGAGAIARLRRLMLLATLATGAIAAASALGAPDRADAKDCGIKMLCLYQNVDYGGRFFVISQLALDDGGPVAVRGVVSQGIGVSSWINTTDFRICAYERGFFQRPRLFSMRQYRRDTYVGDAVNNRTDFIKRC